jgi:hypothetical protein
MTDEPTQGATPPPPPETPATPPPPTPPEPPEQTAPEPSAAPAGDNRTIRVFLANLALLALTPLLV